MSATHACTCVQDAPHDAPACPCGAQIARAGDPASADCEVCRHFRCPRCERWVPWSKGCGDDLAALCDDCWLAVEYPRAALPGVVPPPTDAIEALGDHPMEPCS